VLLGGLDEDLLVGGTTALDASDAALRNLMAEWNSGRDLEARTLNLSGGGEGERLNGDGILAATASDESAATVFDDGSADFIAGGPGSDWVFAGTSAEDEGERDRVFDVALMDLVNGL
jgi:hypothetical protein